MKSIKYIVIIFLGSFLIFKNLPIGDYCFGLLTGLISILLFGLLFIIVILFTIINIFKVSKKKEKFDIIPLILFIFFSLTYFYIVNSDKKFWTDVKINGIFLNENIKSSLILYKNNTFAITCDFIENSCIYQGEYEIIKQKITLKRDNIINITDSLFTNEYTINYKDSVLVPNNTNFEKIKILNNDNQ